MFIKFMIMFNCYDVCTKIKALLRQYEHISVKIKFMPPVNPFSHFMGDLSKL